MRRPVRTDATALDGHGTGNMPRVRVWDPLVRVFHWSLVLSFAIAWLSAHSWENLHNWAGYAAGGLVVMRAAWGFVGTPYARSSQFVRPPGAVLAYLKAVMKGSEPRCVGHNPAGGAMIVALILAMLSTAFTGWLLTTDAFWGVVWMQHVHHWLAHGLLLLVVFHLGGVVLASYRHRENLVAAMISGRKRATQSDDIN
jgi:cytochrome b